jgi:hypothetical protein
MSYLNSPRLTFSGQFQADPSTVNNDPTHFNNATFEPMHFRITPQLLTPTVGGTQMVRATGVLSVVK